MVIKKILSRSLKTGGACLSLAVVYDWSLEKQEKNNIKYKKQIIQKFSIGNCNQLNNKYHELNIKNLVFQGGGPKGITYVGALKCLEEKLGKNFAKIERVAGTSAGAITAVLLGVGYAPEEIKYLLNKTPFKKFIVDGDQEKNTDDLVVELVGALTAKSTLRKSRKAIESIMLRPFSFYYLLKKICIKKGACTGEVFRNWLEDAISSQVAKIEGGRKEDFQYLTFGQLKKLRKNNPQLYKEIYIVGAMFDSNNSLDKPNIYSTENSSMENYIISDAVRVSMSIPFLFMPHNIHYLNSRGERKEVEDVTNVSGGIDGGVLKNYPIDIFDYNKYLSEPFLDKLPSEKLLNLETLGFALYEKRHINVISWVQRTIEAIKNKCIKNLEPLQINPFKELVRSIMVNTCDISLFDFNMPQSKLNALIQSGEDSVEQHWAKEIEKIYNNQKKESENKIKFFEEIIQEFRNYHKSNLLFNHPSKDYIKSAYIDKLDSVVQSSGYDNILVCGVGGVGKSSLIAGYLYEDYLKKMIMINWEKGIFYDKIPKPIIWILNRDNNDKNAYLNSFLGLYNKILNENKKEFSLEDSSCIKELFSELGKDQWLIVFDDCNNFNQVEPFINNKFTKGKIIITSRDNELIPLGKAGGSYKFQVTGFNKDDCILFINQIEKNIKSTDASIREFHPKDDPESIIIASSGFPLYLKAAVTRVYAGKIETYSKYLENIQIYEDPLNGNDKRIGITILQKAIILESINTIKLHPPININGKNITARDAYQVLQLCGYLHENDIFQGLINQNDYITLKDVMHIISKTSLIWKTRYDQDVESQLYNIHAITQHCLKEKLIHVKKLVNNLATLFTKDTRKERARKVNSLLLPHVNAILSSGINDMYSDKNLMFQMIKLLNVKAYFYTQIDINVAKQAETLSLQAKHYCEEIAGIDKANLKTSVEQLYINLSNTAGLDEDNKRLLPIIYASILYTYGRMKFYGRDISEKDAKACLSLCIKICEFIEQNTNKKILYKILAQRNGLLYFTNKPDNTVEELLNNIKAYTSLASSSSGHNYIKLDEINKIVQQVEALEDSRNERAKAIDSLAIGNFYLAFKDWDKALTYFEKVMNIESTKKDYPMADANEGLAVIYYSKNDMLKAKDGIKRCLEIRRGLYKDSDDKIQAAEDLQNKILSSTNYSSYDLQNQFFAYKQRSNQEPESISTNEQSINQQTIKKLRNSLCNIM